MTLGIRAHNLYGQNTNYGSVISAVPRSKFNFKCQVNTIEASLDLDRVANVTMPSYNTRAQVQHSYNRKRIVQTGVDYTPITLTAYDTRDAAIENFLKSYSDYYYAGPMNTSNLSSHNLDGKGYKLQNDRHYIKTFVIRRINSTEDTNVITLFNPMISAIESDTLDYSDSGLVQYRITFMYEGYDIQSS